MFKKAPEVDVKFPNSESRYLFHWLYAAEECEDQTAGPELRRRLMQLAIRQEDWKEWLAHALRDTVGEDIYALSVETLFDHEELGHLCTELLQTAACNICNPSVAEAVIKAEGEWDRYLSVCHPTKKPRIAKTARATKKPRAKRKAVA
jgi:hypothetical protein